MKESVKIITNNKKASYDYFFESKYEAGIVLLGSEIKSIREGKVNIKDSYVRIKDGEAYVINMHISEYEKSSLFNHEPTRSRKLLLKKREIIKLNTQVQEKGYTLIPTKLYFKGSHAKLEIALAKGKKNYDKRERDKKRTIEKDISRAIKEFNK